MALSATKSTLFAVRSPAVRQGASHNIVLLGKRMDRGGSVSSGIAHDDFFRAVTSPKFQRENIADLAVGRCTAVVVPDCVPTSLCEATLRALASAPFTTYGAERVYPPVMRFGVGISDYRRDGLVDDSYWEALEEGRRAWASLA